MRSVVAVGVIGALAGAMGLVSLTLLPRAGTDDAPDVHALHATIDAELQRGARAWHDACPVAEIDGACALLAPPVASRPPARCAPGSERHRIAVPRDPGKRAIALAAFAHVIDLLATAPATPELRDDLGLARLYEGDALREAALAIAVPTDLDSEPRLHAWLDARNAARERAAAAYAEVLASRRPDATIAALARTAQLAEDVADELFTLDIPSALRAGNNADDANDKIDAYCDAVTAAAEPVLATATDGYAACFAKATELDAFSSWSTLCETALERLEPTRYPMLGEQHRRPDPDASPWRTPDAPWLDAGLLALQHRSYAVAEHLFVEAVAVAPTSYDALVGLGIARRGLGDLDAAEASYARARAIDPTRSEADYDLGILDKDFRANVPSDPDPIVALHRAREIYVRARGRFAQAVDRSARASDRTDAQEQIVNCDKVIAQVDAYVRAEGGSVTSENQ